jgi:hypothetical protein
MSKCFYGFYRFNMLWQDNGVHSAGKTMEFEVSQASEEDPHYIVALSTKRLQDAGFTQLAAALFPPISVFDGDKTYVLNLFWKAVTNPEKVVVSTDPSGAHLMILAPTCFTIDLFKMHGEKSLNLSGLAGDISVDSSAADPTTARALAEVQELIAGGGSVRWTVAKLAVCGGGGVGKTSCINALSGAPFEAECESTVGAKVIDSTVCSTVVRVPLGRR